jgi:hypothetical protein
MISASGGYSYFYDGDGNRVEKCTAGSGIGSCATSPTGTLYWADIGGNNISETDLSGNLQEEYMYFGLAHPLTNLSEATPPFAVSNGGYFAGTPGRKLI